MYVSLCVEKYYIRYAFNLNLGRYLLKVTFIKIGLVIFMT